MKLSDLDLFIRTADSGNITAAARELDISPAAASAALKRLEQQLDTNLFIRTTRKLRLTEAGERYLPHCRRALCELKEAQQALEQDKTQLTGALRISVSSDFGRNALLPWLDEFMQLHPKLSISLDASDSVSDFYHDRVDIALRYGKPEDSSLIAFPICESDRVVCASPAYIKKYGTPTHPNDLTEHNCLLYLLGDRTYDLWSFRGDQELMRIRVQGNRICNDADLVHRWAISGQGIAFKSRLDMAEDLYAGRVVELMPEFSTEPANLWLICPNRKQVTPAVIMFRDMLRQRCKTLLKQ
ncbi:LysR family transcriptional regulator [Neptunomonas sp.]|uniref:LysR family transcriptional regulator n=1 Tax=Neptunomonas sp. TaxID=1971898 RepID=UPI0025DB0CDF|nr:LysR family transcriptional regulator [Neptunomonas sp.]